MTNNTFVMENILSVAALSVSRDYSTISQKIWINIFSQNFLTYYTPIFVEY